MLARIADLLRILPPAREPRGLLQASGTVVPTDATDGYQTGCTFQHTDGAAESAFYVNEGSVTSCDFNAVVPSGSAELADLSDVGATVYTAGMVLVADGDSYEEVAISSHATLAASGALTLATVSKVMGIRLSDWHPGGSGVDYVNVMTSTPQGDGAELGLAVTASAVITGTSTNNSDATEHMVLNYIIPEDYVVGEDLILRIMAHLSAAANATSDLDVVAKVIKDGAIDSTDLCATAAKDLKAVVAAADQDFTITGDATGDELAAGDLLNLAVSFQRDDTGGSTAGTTLISRTEMIVPCYR